MNSAICTLFEGDYHYGLGALVNSLYRHGFRGVIWAAYRGSLPPWATGLRDAPDYQEFSVGQGCVIRFVPVDTSVHFANYKPRFILDVWERLCPEAEALFYFDPDITIKCRWGFYEEWITHGVAICQEIINSAMPDDHPIRMGWKAFLEQRGYPVRQQVNQYFNSGFLGVTRPHMSILTLWRDIIESLKDMDVDITKFFTPLDRSHLILSPDQDALNIALMTCSHPRSTIGPEGMDLVPGGFTMSHAIGSPKPWRKKMIREALRGKAVGPADKGYWANTQGPIQLYSARTFFWKHVALRASAAIGRFIQRS